MSVKTQFGLDTFENVLKSYDLGELLSFIPVAKGTVQTNYILQTTKARAVFRYYENRTRESVLFELDLLSHLRRHKYPCPLPYESRNGLQTIEGKPYVLFEFKQGEHAEHPTMRQEQELIRHAALLDKITENYISPYTAFRDNYNVEFCKRYADRMSRRAGTENAKRKLKWYHDQLQTVVLPPALPVGVCHCNFHFSNVLYTGDVFSALLDFDDANLTYLTYDLVSLFSPFREDFDWDTWQNFSRETDVLSFEKARGVVKTYEQFRPLSGVEKHHLFDVCKLGILVDCLWYFTRGDAADFYEKRKVDSLNALGREGFFQKLFNP